MTVNAFVKSPVVFKQKKSFKRRCSELLLGKGKLRSSVSESFLPNRNNRLFRSFHERKKNRKATSSSSIENLDESTYTVDDHDDKEEQSTMFQRSINRLSVSKRAVGRRVSRSNDEIRNHFSKVKVEECMAVSYDAQLRAVPILRLREQIVNDDFIIWEEEMKYGMFERRRLFVTAI